MPRKLVIEYLHKRYAFEGSGFDHLDTNGDAFISPIDALLIINWLNQYGAGPTHVDPVAKDFTFSIDAGTSRTINLEEGFVDDRDCDAIALIAIARNTGGLSVETDGSLLTITAPSEHVSGLFHLDYTVTDDHNGVSNLATIAITVTAGDGGGGGGNTEFPVIAGGTTPSLEVGPETTGHFVIDASDPQGDPLSFTVTSVPQHGVAGVTQDGHGTYVAASGYDGPDAFVVTVSDGSHPVEVTFTVNVTSGNGGGANHPPVAPNDVQWDVIAGVPAVFPLGATDPDGDILSYSFSYLPAHGEYSIDTLGNFRFVGDVLFAPETVTVLIDISDGQATTTIRRQLNSHLPPPEGEGEGEPGDWELGVDAVLGGDLEDILAPTLVA